ncbi:tetratricopeptide repeat protein [Spirochaeta africana]|uniref:Tetratricopeptide repeat protein n=1 Tax=Spirochaeta africana (strain ATCC 700263 / DSM 8902 / Z-7692) TaxID=889378 RepID=H9UI97_SPIAZ|nr:tetratricopeptide repeat protein [Spirochaeta africana]AFG37240.1 tetratricopeptide repeat protein [Spirochaeta africana DSM 8902]
MNKNTIPVTHILWITALVLLMLLAGALYAGDDDYQEYMDLILTHAAEGEHAEAIALYRDLEPPEDFRYEHWYNFGVLLFDAGRYVESADAFARAIDLAPRSENALFNAGTALLNAGEYREAEELFSQLLEIADDPRGFLNRGNARYAQQDLSRAAADYRQAIELNPSLPDAHYNYGNLLYDQQEWMEAEQAFTRAIEIDAGFTEARFNRGNVRMQLGLYAAALEDYQSVVARDPDNEDALQNAAIAEQLIEQGDNE